MLRLNGIVTALLSPFRDDGELDRNSLRDLLDFQISSNVDGLFLCGTTGLGPLMRLDQRKEVVEVAVEKVKTGSKVIAHVGAPDTETSIRLAKHAADVGVDAVGCVTPYYYKFDRPSILEHYRQVASAVDVPLLAYNIPSHTGINLTAEILLELSNRSKVAGVKDTSGDLAQLNNIIELLPEDFAVMSGSDSLMLPAFLTGAQAAVSALANVVPETCKELHSLFKLGKIAEANSIQRELTAILRILPEPKISALYHMLKARKIDSGTSRQPLRRLTLEEAKQLDIGLKKLGVALPPMK